MEIINLNRQIRPLIKGFRKTENPLSHIWMIFLTKTYILYSVLHNRSDHHRHIIIGAV